MEGEVYNFITPVIRDITLDAEWIHQGTSTFDIVFETGSDTQIQTQTLYKGQKVMRPDDPAKRGDIFDKWYQDALCIIPVDFKIYTAQNVEGSGKSSRNDSSNHFFVASL